MANICSNKITVIGTPTGVGKFVDDFFRTETDPNGEDYQGFYLEGAYPDCDNIPDFSLGSRCRTDSKKVTISHLKNERANAQFWLDSPWGPPRDIFTRLSTDRPELEFVINYDEPNLEERGTFIVKGGEVRRND